MSAYGSYLPRFAGSDAQVVGVSTDSIYSHLAWQEKSIGWQEYPMASDYWPHGGIAQKYGILREGEPLPGINERAIFIVDKQGKIAFAKVYELGQEPDYEELVTQAERVNSATAAGAKS
jgi:alkyl hydroperoxide reductase subunit AhpC